MKKEINNKFIYLILFIEVLLVSLIVKLYIISFYFIKDKNNTISTIFQVISHDSIIFSFILLCLYFAYLKHLNIYISIILRIIVLIVFTLYLLDLLILMNFSTHLVFSDIFKYLNYAPQYLQQELDFNIWIVLGIFIFVSLSYLFLKVTFQVNKKKHHLIFIFSIIITIILYQLSNNGQYIHSWIFKNFIEYNYEVTTQSKDYSKELKQKITIDDNIICKNKKSQDKNVIILMVESLSSYQSNFFSGIKNWTPNLDNIAKKHMSFKNFHSNGFMTEDAEISILTGLFPIYAPKIFSNGGGVSFTGFYNIKNSLPNILNNFDYQTEFITSSDLNFSNTGQWAKSIGFKYIEGSSHVFYNNKKRYHFEAAADEYLYKRVLSRIDRQTSKYFMFIKTVTSHIPFINPENDNYSEEETIRYVDKYIGIFYQELIKRNFFKDGLLVITGDHHPLIPLKKAQVLKYGEFKAHVATPLIVIGNKKNVINNSQYQQTDIFNSIKNYLSVKSCTSNWIGDFLRHSPKPPKYTLYRRGDNRGVISIFKESKTYNIRLNGDDTKITNHVNIPEIVNKINFERIQRQHNR